VDDGDDDTGDVTSPSYSRIVSPPAPRSRVSLSQAALMQGDYCY